MFTLDIFFVSTILIGGLIFLSLVLGASKNGISILLSLSSSGIAIVAIKYNEFRFAIVILVVCAVIEFGILAYRCIKKEIEDDRQNK